MFLKKINRTYRFLFYKNFNKKKCYLTDVEFYFCQITNKFYIKKNFVWKKYLLNSKIFWSGIINCDILEKKKRSFFFNYWWSYRDYIYLYTNVSILNNWLKKGFFCELSLFGLGYRILQVSTNLFRFFLGFSTFIYLIIPDHHVLLFSRILDRKLLIFGFDPRKINSIVSSLMLLKQLSVYRLVGITKPSKFLRFKSGKLR